MSVKRLEQIALKSLLAWVFPGASVVKNPPCNAGLMQVRSLVPGKLSSHTLWRNCGACLPQLESPRAPTKDPT